jgi:disulfide oxidoreductase YuzD
MRRRKLMKKSILLFMVMTFLLVGCSFGVPTLKQSTSSQIEVIEKDYSEDYKESWIMAYNPNNSTKDKAIKIIVEEPMVWNLIKVNKTYVASYSKDGDKPWILEQIEHVGDEKTLR